MAPYYSSKSYFLPSIVVREEELFTLIDSMETVKNIGNPLLTKKLQNSYKKLAKYLPENIKIDLDSLTSHSIIVSPPGLRIDENIWKTITDGIKLKHKIKIEYKSPGKDNFTERELLPYYLLFSKGGWYLLAKNEVRKRIETYALFRMKKANLLRSKFIVPKDFIDPEMGIFSKTEDYEIEIEFDKWTAPYIRERLWHTGQTINRSKNGSIILRFKTNQLDSVKFQLLPWGAGSKVINPPELREMMIEVIEDMRDKYRE